MPPKAKSDSGATKGGITLPSSPIALHADYSGKIIRAFLADLVPAAAVEPNPTTNNSDRPKPPSFLDLPTQTEADLIVQTKVFEEWLQFVHPKISPSFSPQKSTQIEWSMDILSLGLLTKQPIPIIERLLGLLQEQLHIINVINIQNQKNHGSQSNHPLFVSHRDYFATKLRTIIVPTKSEQTLFAALNSSQFIPPFVIQNFLNPYDTSFFSVYWSRFQRFIFLSIFIHYPTLLSLAMSILFESDFELHTDNFNRFFSPKSSVQTPSYDDQPLLSRNTPSYHNYDQSISEITLSLFNLALKHSYDDIRRQYAIENAKLVGKTTGCEMKLFSQFYSANSFFLPPIMPKAGGFKHDYEQHLLVGNEHFFNISHISSNLISQKPRSNTGNNSAKFLFGNEAQLERLGFRFVSNTDTNLLFQSKTRALLSGAFTSSLLYYRQAPTESLFQIVSPLTTYLQKIYSTPINSLTLYNMYRNGMIPSIMNPRLFRIHPSHVPFCDHTVVTNYPIFFSEQVYKYQPSPIKSLNRPILYPIFYLFCDYLKQKYKRLSLTLQNENDIANFTFSFLPQAILTNDSSLKNIDRDQLSTLSFILGQIHASLNDHQLNSHFNIVIDTLLHTTLPFYTPYNSPPSLIPFVIFSLVTLLPPTDGYIIPYFSHLLPYTYPETGDILWEINPSPHIPTVSEVCLAVYACMADMISYPSLFEQSSVVFEHANLVKNSRNSTQIDALYYRSQTVPLHSRLHTTDVDNNGTSGNVENSFSLLSYILSHYNIDNFDVFFDLFQTTQQFELTQPISFCYIGPEAAKSIYYNYNETTFIHTYADLFKTTQKGQQDDKKRYWTAKFAKKDKHLGNGTKDPKVIETPKSSLLLSILISRRYHGTILQFFLSLDGIDYDYVDDFGMTVLDYCIFFNTFSYAPDFVLGVVERTRCSFFKYNVDGSAVIANYEGDQAKLQDDDAKSETLLRLKKRLKLIWNPILYKLRSSYELERVNIFKFPTLFSYLFQVFLFLPVDSPVPLELIDAIARKEFSEQYGETSGQDYGRESVGGGFTDQIPPGPSIPVELDFVGKVKKSFIYQNCEQLLPLVLVLFLTRCENLMENNFSQTFLSEILTKLLQINYFSQNDDNNITYQTDEERLEQMNITIIPRYIDDQNGCYEDQFSSGSLNVLKPIPVQAMQFDENGSTIHLLPVEFYQYTYDTFLNDFNDRHNDQNQIGDKVKNNKNNKNNKNTFWTIFDRIYLIHFLTDSNFDVEFLTTLYRTIPSQFVYFLFYFYQLPPHLALQHCDPTISSLQQFPVIPLNLDGAIQESFLEQFSGSTSTPKPLPQDSSISPSREYLNHYISILSASKAGISSFSFIWSKPLYISSIHDGSGTRFSNTVYSTYLPRLRSVEEHYIDMVLQGELLGNNGGGSTNPKKTLPKTENTPPTREQYDNIYNILELFKLSCSDTLYSTELMNPIYRQANEPTDTTIPPNYQLFFPETSFNVQPEFQLGEYCINNSTYISSPHHRVEFHSPYTQTPYFSQLVEYNDYDGDAGAPKQSQTVTLHQNRSSSIRKGVYSRSISIDNNRKVTIQQAYSTVKDNISPSFLDLILSKPQYLSYFDMCLAPPIPNNDKNNNNSDPLLLKIIDLDPISQQSPINLLHSSYLIQFYSQILSDLHSTGNYFHNCSVFHPPQAASNIWNNYSVFLSPSQAQQTPKSTTPPNSPPISPTCKQNNMFFSILTRLHRVVVKLFPTLELQPHILVKIPLPPTAMPISNKSNVGKPHRALLHHLITHLVRYVKDTTLLIPKSSNKYLQPLRLPPFNALHDEAAKLLGNTTKKQIIDLAHAEYVKSCQVPRYKQTNVSAMPHRIQRNLPSSTTSSGSIEQNELYLTGGIRRTGK
jgi:hypothetical protein